MSKKTLYVFLLAAASLGFSQPAGADWTLPSATTSMRSAAPVSMVATKIPERY